MIYDKIPYLDKPVSRIVFGSSVRSVEKGHDCDALFDEVVRQGINVIDTARYYGYAEENIGKWLAKRGKSDDLVLLTKGAIDGFFGKRIKESCIRRDLKKSFEKLGVDYVDIYLLHRDDRSRPVGPIMETLNALHAEGKIGVFGGSNWKFDRIEAANEYAYAHNLQPMSVSSPNFGLAETSRPIWLRCTTISGDNNAEEREWYKKNQMPIFAYSSIGRGFFSGKIDPDDASTARFLERPVRKAFWSENNLERLRRVQEYAKQKGMTVTQVALAWIFKRGLNVFAITGSNSPAHVGSNAVALSCDMTEAEAEYLNLEREKME